MGTLPRMRAPIGRLKITPSEGRSGRGSGSGRWKAADPPTEAEGIEAEEPREESNHPPFYPFPLRATAGGED